MNRYTAHQIGDFGKWYVYDELKGQVAWANLNSQAAAEMAADLNAVHENSPSPAGIPEGVIQRLAEQVVADETQATLWASKVVAAMDAGDDENVALLEHGIRVKQQLASDIRCVLVALGVATGV